MKRNMFAAALAVLALCAGAVHAGGPVTKPGAGKLVGVAIVNDKARAGLNETKVLRVPIVNDKSKSQEAKARAAKLAAEAKAKAASAKSTTKTR